MRAIKKVAGVWTCFICGAAVPDQSAPHRGRCVCEQPAKRGLGDMVAAGLSAVGITPEQVSAALGVKDCGCKKRQQQLNDLGRRLGIG
jgi:hypothetical protein